MKVFLGGTVNGSKWRSRFKEELMIDYFDPVVDDWNEAAYERELSERRNCEYLLYILTPKMTGFYAVAEVTDDSYKKPDRTLFCYLPEDNGDKFTADQIREFEMLGEVVTANGAKWLKSIDEVIAFLNSGKSLEKDDNTRFYDAFISYGRRESMMFANKIANRLSEADYTVYEDVNEIPLIIEYEEYIYKNILRSDNFIYIISPNAVRSEYCKKELDFAIKYNKRIIPVLHIALQQDLEKLDDIVAKKKTLVFDNMTNDIDALVHQIREVIDLDKAYMNQHSKYLFKARNWDFKGRPQGELLYGQEKKNALEWLEKSSASIVPLQIQQDYILASKNLSPLMLPLLWLNEKTKNFTNKNWFDRITLLISLGNPVALIPQLRDLIFADSPQVYANVSVPMWIGFLIIQVALTFVGIKNKDLGLFISMFLSLIVSASVITLVILNT